MTHVEDSTRGGKCLFRLAALPLLTMLALWRASADRVRGRSS